MSENIEARELPSKNVSAGFGNLQSYELALRVAKMFASSDLVPMSYRLYQEKRGVVVENKQAIANCMVAFNMAQRMNADPLMVMQNLNNIEGHPSWSSQYIIAALNNCGRFSPLRFDLSEPEPPEEVEYTYYGEWNPQLKCKEQLQGVVTIRNQRCKCRAVEHASGERLESPEISLKLAVREGWYTRKGSKWLTLPELMLQYRAAAFFGRLYAPEVLMGLRSEEEAREIYQAERDVDGTYSVQTAPEPEMPRRKSEESAPVQPAPDDSPPETQAPPPPQTGESPPATEGQKRMCFTKLKDAGQTPEEFCAAFGKSVEELRMHEVNDALALIRKGW